MGKNRFICKLLSLFAVTGTFLIATSVYQNASAISADDIVSRLQAERGTIAKEMSQKRQDRILEDYQYLSRLRKNADFQQFLSTNCTNESEIDSASFLSLIDHVNNFYEGSNNKKINAFKESLLKRMISLRSTEEFRSDKYIALKFDQYFKTHTKKLLREIRPCSPSDEKTHEVTDEKEQFTF